MDDGATGCAEPSPTLRGPALSGILPAVSEPVALLTLPDEVTPAQVPALDAEATSSLGVTGARLLVDLERVTFLSSGGLGFLVKLSKRLHDRGGGIALARPRPPVARLLRSVGLELVLPTFSDLGAARAHLDGVAR